MTKFITAPVVCLIAGPQIFADGISKFLNERGLKDVANDDGSTLNTLLVRMGTAASYVGEAQSDQGQNLVEFAGRQCYASWRKGRPQDEYLANIVETKHGSVTAHAHYSFYLGGLSRALTLELNRHAVGVDISQESQRYVDADNAGFVVPPLNLDYWQGDLECGEAQDWMAANIRALEAYRLQRDLLREHLENHPDVTSLEPQDKRSMVKKRANEAARYLLPNAIETGGVWTFSVRALRHIVGLRGDAHADLEIRRLAAHLAEEIKKVAPGLFFDVTQEEGSFGVPTVKVVNEKI